MKRGRSLDISYEYDNDDIGRRTVAAHTGTAFAASAFSLYGYNDRGEVADARRYLGTDTSDTSSPVSAQDWEYEYDSIGNRESRTVAQGTPTTYTANQLNQYTATADPAEAFSFDTDGNMTGDGTWDYTWNAENRLTAAEPGTPAAGSRVPGPRLKRSRDTAVLRVEVPT
jgi:YD repeat-containing protein